MFHFITVDIIPEEVLDDFIGFPSLFLWEGEMCNVLKDKTG